MLKSPPFWHKKTSLLATLLAPLGYLYGSMVYLHRRLQTPQKLPVPVLCIGNIVLGGAGKTPTTLTIARLLQESGHIPHILTRGYGRNNHVLLRVDPQHHHFAEVGDEALLLARVAPTWVHADRFLAGQRAIAAGATILLMDDGYQNNRIIKDYHLLVMDTYQGIGNGKVFPAGPLREFLGPALQRADAMLAIGQGDCLFPSTNPTFQGSLTPQELPFPSYTEITAFAGIGYPLKFRKTLEELSWQIKHFKAFPDHHPYSESDIEPLLAKGYPLITTEKDWLRLPEAYQSRVHFLKVELQIADIEAFRVWLKKCC